MVPLRNWSNARIATAIVLLSVTAPPFWVPTAYTCPTTLSGKVIDPLVILTSICPEPVRNETTFIVAFEDAGNATVAFPPGATFESGEAVMLRISKDSKPAFWDLLFGHDSMNKDANVTAMLRETLGYDGLVQFW